jgi:transposase
LEGVGIVSRNLFWPSDEQWERIEPHLPTDVRGVERVDDRRVISGVVHVLKSGCRWCDCPEAYGPSKTIYNRLCAGHAAASGKSCSVSLPDKGDPRKRK